MENPEYYDIIKTNTVIYDLMRLFLIIYRKFKKYTAISNVR